MKARELKKIFLSILIASLILVSLVAVVSVLIGEFNSVSRRAITTLFIVAIHSFICLGFVKSDEDDGFIQDLNFFRWVLFAVVIASFLVLTLGTWKIMSGGNVARTYITFVIVMFAALHGDLLYNAAGKKTHIDVTIILNYVFMSIVTIMLFPIIYNADLGSIYYRILGASSIIDGTCTILVVIFYNLHFRENPKKNNVYGIGVDNGKLPEKTLRKKKGLSMWILILIIYLLLQAILPLASIFSYMLK